MNAPLSNDAQRCYGIDCHLKDTCRRYLTIEIDTVGTQWIYDNLTGLSGYCLDYSILRD